MKCCADCKLTLPESSFAPRGGGRTGRGSYCRPCLAIRNLRSREKRGKRGKPSVWRQDDPLNIALGAWIRTSERREVHAL